MRHNSAVSTARNVDIWQAEYSTRVQRCVVIWQEETCCQLNATESDRIQGDAGGERSVFWEVVVSVTVTKTCV
jgi:hypothetical protein